MTLTLELSPQEEARLREKAARQGQDATDYAVALLRHDIEKLADDKPTLIPQGTPEWRAALRNIGRPLGFSLSIEATSRENIYDDELP